MNKSKLKFLLRSLVLGVFIGLCFTATKWWFQKQEQAQLEIRAKAETYFQGRYPIYEVHAVDCKQFSVGYVCEMVIKTDPRSKELIALFLIENEKPEAASQPPASQDQSELN